MIKAGMSVAEAILQLTRGFKKVMGRNPDGLEQIKIQQEAVERLKNLEKVVDMEGNVIDTSKGIMGGRQIQDNKEFGEALKKALMETDNPYSDLVKTTKKGPKTLEQRRKEAEKALKNKNVTPIKDPEDMAQGGRAGFANGSPLDPFDPSNKLTAVINAFRKLPRRSQEKIGFKKFFEIYAEENFATGGRAGFKLGSIDKARRAFLKTMGAAGAGIGALKTGILGLGEKAAPMVEAARETVTQAPSYFFDLVAKIKMLGKPGMSISERQNVTVYKNYELTEDVTTGDLRITKQKGNPDGPGYKEEVMEYNKGGVPDEDIGMTRESYDEATLFPDMDGKMKDIEDGIEPDSIQEIMEEITKEAPSIKKAGGGIARMLGE